MNDCIDFKGCKNEDGYGMVSRKVGGKWRPIGAHRVAYAEAYGHIPEGMCVCHKCDNRACVNVDHLFLGTHADNMRDMAGKGRGRGTGQRGSKHHAAKLTELEVPRIRDMLACGCKQQDIADWFGVSFQLISLIKLGKRWAHVA